MCSPLAYCPPEWHDPSQKAEGVFCDVWLYGLMALQVLTGHWPNKNMKTVPNCRKWKKNAEPFLLKALKKKKFYKIMKNAFPSIALSDSELSEAHDFVTFTMKWKPSKRQTLQQIKEHPFFDSLKHPIITNDTRSNWIEIKTVEKYQDFECRINHPVRKNMPQLNYSNDIKSNSNYLKPAVTNPFLEGWTDQNPKNPFLSNSNCIEFLNNLKSKTDYLDTLEKFQFHEGWAYLIPAKTENSIQETSETEKDRTLVPNIWNEQSLNEFEMPEERNQELPALERRKENCGSYLQHIISEEKNSFKKDSTIKKRRTFPCFMNCIVMEN